MKKIYLTLAAAVCGMASAYAAEPIDARVLTLDGPQVIKMAGDPVQVTPAVETGYAIQSPARVNALDPYDISGEYINMFKNIQVSTIANMEACENIIITQDGNNIYVEGIGGMSAAALADDPNYYFYQPLHGTIDFETGRISFKGGQPIVGLRHPSGGLNYLSLFYTDSPGYITVTNGTEVWAHIEGNKLVWDKAGLLYCACGGQFGSGVPVSNSPVSSVYYCKMSQANAELSFRSKVGTEFTEYSAPAWYEYVKRNDGIYLRMSGMVLDKTNSFVTEWKLDETTDYAIAENQAAWYDVNEASMYYLTTRDNRGKFGTTCPASVKERQNITWPVDYNGKKYTAWVVKNTRNSYFGLNDQTTLRGDWYGNYPPLYMENDENEWYPHTPIEIAAEDGLYHYTLPEGITEFSISTMKGTNEVDFETYGRGAFGVVADVEIVPGYVYDLVGNPDGVIVLGDFAANGPITIHVDVDLLRIWVTVEEPVVETTEVYFDNGNKDWTNPYVVYSLDEAVTWEEPVAMRPSLTLAPAKVLSFESDSENVELWVADIPANATHVKFTDGGSEETPVFVYDAEQEEPYKDPTVSGIQAVNAASTSSAVYYNLQGIRVANPVEGNVYIVKSGNTIVKKAF